MPHNQSAADTVFMYTSAPFAEPRGLNEGKHVQTQSEQDRIDINS